MTRLYSRIALSVGLLVVFAGSAWSQATTQPDTPDAPVQPEMPEKAAAPVMLDEPEVVLVDAGAEPRQELRLRPKAGDKSDLVMTMRMSMNQKINGAELPAQKIPSMIMTLRVEVTDIEDNGDIAYNFEFAEGTTGDEEGVMPMVAAMVKESLQSMVGLKGEAIVTSRGIAKSTKLDVPAGANPMVKQQADSIQQSMSQMSFPLPEEPVGVGGKWQVKNSMNNGGMNLDQVADVTVSKIDGDALELNVELNQTGKEQDMELPPGMPPGATMRLLSLASTGTGMIAWPMTSPFPTSSEMTMTNDTMMSMKMNEIEQKVEQHMDMTVNLDQATVSAE